MNSYRSRFTNWRRWARWAAVSGSPLPLLLGVLCACSLVPIWLSSPGPCRPAGLPALPLRLLLSAGVLAVPLAVLLLARQLGRTPVATLLTPSLALGPSLVSGDLIALATLPLVPLALSQLLRAAEGPAPAVLAGLFVAGATVALLDPWTWSLLGAGGLAGLFCLGRRALAPTAALLLSGTLLIVRGAPLLSAGAWKFETARAALEQLPRRLLFPVPGSGAGLCLLALALSWILLAGSAAGPGPPIAPPRLAPRDWLLELWFCLGALAYVLLPLHPAMGAPCAEIKIRLLPQVALLGALLVRGPVVGRHLWLVAPAVLAGVAYPLLLARHLLATGRAP